MGTRVLIVDDSRAQRFIVRQCLAGQPVEVVAEAVDGEDAIQKFGLFHPDLVLLDLVMPRLDGQAALDRILDDDPNARVIIMSSLGSEETVRACLARGAHSYLQKPVTTETLVAAIARATQAAAEPV